jgi:hypothetical protein
MSCWDCLRILFPSSYQFTQPTYELEELVIVNNNNTTETTYLKQDRKNKQSNLNSENCLSHSELQTILEDEEELIYQRNSSSSPVRDISPIREYSFQNLSDTEVYGNQKLKKRRKRHRMLSEKRIKSPSLTKKKATSNLFIPISDSCESSNSEWDDSLIIS